jgi:G:T/U-mismatch repair DNA glycosylase
MFNHTHPYPLFIPEGTTKLIVGTLPPPRFTTGDLKERDVNFCYGSRDGQLWPILNAIFGLNLRYENSEFAVDQRKNFLISRGIGVCDIVASSKREKIDASDLGMQQVQLRDIIKILTAYPKVDTLLFTGGNSKNGPEFFFRKLLKTHQLQLEVLSSIVPRIHQFSISAKNKNLMRTIRTISLTAPSGAANRAVGGLDAYKKMKNEFPEKTTIDFRVEQYTPFF